MGLIGLGLFNHRASKLPQLMLSGEHPPPCPHQYNPATACFSVVLPLSPMPTRLPLSALLGLVCLLLSLTVQAQTPVVSGTLSVSLTGDANTNGQANAGDQLSYTAVITNSGSGSATGVNLTLPAPANTTLVTGSLKTSTLARPDSYTTLISGTLSGSSVLTNDFGLPTKSVTAFGPSASPTSVGANGANSAPTDRGGTVVMQPDGSFAYTPPGSFVGYDTFGYTATTATPPSDAATVTIRVGTPVTALPNAYIITGNITNSQSTTAAGLLGNDTGDQRVVTAVNGSTANVGVGVMTTQGGSVTVASNGTFIYEPPAGYEGSDSFTYTANNGLNLPSMATVTLTITGMIWFINNTAAAGGSGTLARPFNTLGVFQAVNNGAGNNPAAGDAIFLYSGSGNYIGGLTLLASQKLIGQGASASLASLAGLSPAPGSAPLPSTGGSSPVIVNAGGSGLTLGQNNLLRGFSLGNASAYALLGSSFGTLSVGEVSITTTGQALSLASGSLSGSLASVSSSGGSNNVNLANLTGSVSLNGGSLSGASGTAFLVSGGSVSLSSAAGLSQASNAALVSVSGGHSGNLLFQSGTLTASNGSGLQFDNADGVYSFNGPTTLAGGDAGIDITNGSAGSFSFAIPMTITNPSSVGLTIQSSAATVNFNAGLTVNKNATAGNGVVISANTGAVTFHALAITTSNGAGFVATNNTGGLTVTNATGSINATNGAALDLSNASGNPPVNLNFASLTSTNSTGYGLNLIRIGGSGLQVPGAVTLSTASGSNPTVNISNSTASSVRLGTNGTTHNAVSINNRRATGILVNNVGNTLQFGNITAANPNNVGGYGLRIENSSAAVTINSANISNANQITAQADADNNAYPENDGDGDGIFLKSNTGSFALNGGTINNSGNDGIDIRNCNNISLSNVTISNVGLDVDGATTSGTGGHSIQAFDMLGTCAMTGCTIFGHTKDARDGIRWYNTSPTSSSLTLHACAFTNPSNATTGSNEILVRGDATANMHLIVGGPTNDPATNCTFTNCYGTAINHGAGNGQGSSATVNLTVRNNIFSGTPAGGQNSVAARNVEGGKATVIIENNTFDNVARTSANTAGVIDIGADGDEVGNSISFSIKNNTIKNIGSSVAGSCGSLPCAGSRGIDVFIDDNSVVSGPIVIEGNTITNVQRTGIIFDVGSVFNGSNFTAKVINNIVGTDATPVGLGTALSAGGESGIRVENRSKNAKQMNILVSGNSVRNGNGGMGSSLNTSGIFIRALDAANLQATVTGNNVSTLSSIAQEIRADVNNPSSGAGTAVTCVDISGNTLALGSGTIVFNQITGTLNVEQSSTANAASVNGIPAGNVTTSGSVNFGVTCSAPPL